MNEENNVILTVDHLTKDYGHGRGVFDVSIKVHQGECYGYLGPNGAGKSTTIRHIMGFSKPQSGSVKLFGIETFGHETELLRRVGYLPGEPAIPAGLGGMAFLRMMQDMRGERNEEWLEHLLKLFRFDPHADIRSMSLGEKRKLAVIAAFMNDPEVLILDEPTSGLDPIMQQVFISFIVSEKKRGKTILLSSHIFSEVDATCDTISIIKDGKHVSTFKAEELKSRDTITYRLCFEGKGEYEAAKSASLHGEILNENPHRLSFDVRLNKKDYPAFFDALSGLHVREFEEVPFTLEDYFMSFYKEEKTFDGLKGTGES